MSESQHPQPREHKTGAHLNRLRAAVLGANDGIVSVAGIVVGVAGATNSSLVIATAGLAGLVAGALSMAAGEYVSVSSQRDTERAILEEERQELEEHPERELAELTKLYQKRGLSPALSQQVAQELTNFDAFAAHVDAELGIDPDNLTSPWQAAIASASAFLAGAIIPVIAILIPPANIRVPVAFISVVIALAITGYLSAKAGGASTARATTRVILGGAIAMTITYSVGRLLGVSGI